MGKIISLRVWKRLSRDRAHRGFEMCIVNFWTGISLKKATALWNFQTTFIEQFFIPDMAPRVNVRKTYQYFLGFLVCSSGELSQSPFGYEAMISVLFFAVKPKLRVYYHGSIHPWWFTHFNYFIGSNSTIHQFNCNR